MRSQHGDIQKRTSQQALKSVTKAKRPLSKGDFFPVVRNGLGDPGNAYVHSMAWFRNHLYISFTRYVYYGLRPYDLGKSFEVFPVKVPDPIKRLELVSQGQASIWRFDPREVSWENVHVSPLCMGSKGYEVARHVGFRDMAVFQGASDSVPALYVTSWSSYMGPGPFILRTVDGKIFEEVGIYDRQYFGTQTLRALVPFKGRLYTIPTGRDSGEDGTHQFKAGIVLESKDPALGGWTPVSEPFFGDPGNVMLFEIESFNGFLYVGTMNPYEGFQLWKTDAEGEPPYRWKRVLFHGAYRGKLNEGVCSMCAFGDQLYVGTGIYAGGYDRIYDVGIGAAELIRVNKDDTWDLIVGEPRLTPDGLKVPLSGLAPGFNNPCAGYLWRMCAHQGWFYVGTFVWTPWVPFTKRHDWPKNLKHFLNLMDEEILLRNFGGFQLWRSREGSRWTPVTLNGFGNQYNSGARTMASTPYGLFVGTANQFGPEVAVKRAHGWKYEPNPQSGAEVWLGTHEFLRKETALDAIEIKAESSGDLLSNKNSVIRKANLLNEFYGHSAWRHIGFWRSSTRAAKEACENLMEELLSFTRPTATLQAPRPPTEAELKDWLESPSRAENRGAATPTLNDENVLDVGCGLGETTRYLINYFPPGNVLGVTNDKAELKICRKYVPGITFSYKRLPKLGFSKHTFDKVICVESPCRYKNRNKLFREIYRVLRPDGQVICSDILFCKSGKNGVGSATEYRWLLETIGFEQIWIMDVTKKCVEPFLRHRSDFFGLKRLAGKMDSDVQKGVTASPPDYGNPIRCYLLISARKRGAKGK